VNCAVGGGSVLGVRDKDDGNHAEDANRFEREAASGWNSKAARSSIDGAIEDLSRRDGASDRCPRVLIDGHCNVLWHSSEAERILRPPMPLTIAGRKLHANGASGGQNWASFIENLERDGDRILLTGKEPGTWVLLRCWISRHEGQRLVYIKCITSWPFRDVSTSGLAADFGLTRTECIVLDEFARLRKPEQIAEKLKVSLSTVRSHLKQIHTKMAVNSNIQLLRIIRAYTDT